MPCRFAARISSGSRLEPTGLDDGVTPASAARSSASGNGKKPSEASTAPARARPPCGTPGRRRPDDWADPTEPDQRQPLGQHYPIGGDVLDRAPREVQRRELRQHRVPLRHNARRERLLGQRVARLHQEPAQHTLVIELARQRRRPVRTARAHLGVRGEHAQVALAAELLERVGGEVRRNQILEEHRGDLTRGLVVDHTIGRHRAAKSGLWIGGERFAERVGDRVAQTQSAQVAVFDDGHCRRGEVEHRLPRQVGVVRVVEGRRLAVQLRRVGAGPAASAAARNRRRRLPAGADFRPTACRSPCAGRWCTRPEKSRRAVAGTARHACRTRRSTETLWLPGGV